MDNFNYQRLGSVNKIYRHSCVIPEISRAQALLGKRGLLSGIQALDKWIPDIKFL